MKLEISLDRCRGNREKEGKEEVVKREREVTSAVLFAKESRAVFSSREKKISGSRTRAGPQAFLSKYIVSIATIVLLVNRIKLNSRSCKGKQRANYIYGLSRKFNEIKSIGGKFWRLESKIRKKQYENIKEYYHLLLFTF